MKINRSEWLSNLKAGDKVLHSREPKTIKAIQLVNAAVVAVLTEEIPNYWIEVEAINPFLL